MYLSVSALLGTFLFLDSLTRVIFDLDSGPFDSNIPLSTIRQCEKLKAAILMLCFGIKYSMCSMTQNDIRTIKTAGRKKILIRHCTLLTESDLHFLQLFKLSSIL